MKNKYEQWYMAQLNNIIENGQRRGDRTGTGVISLPDLEYTHDLRESYPLMSGRFFNYQQPITEMIWMMSGSSNIQYLRDNGCPFWNGFATKEDVITQEELNRAERIALHANNRGVPYHEALAGMAMVPVVEIDELLDKNEVPNVRDVTVKAGELGPVYGVQWRHWPNPDGTTFDQLQYALDTLKRDPNSRRVVVDCWNPSFLPDPKISPAENAAKGKMALTPCHFAFGFYTWEIPRYERAGLVKTKCSLSEWMTIYPLRKNTGGYERLDQLCDKYNVPTHYLDLKFIMRSNDWILGQPANMNMYSALLIMFAQQLNMVPRFVKYTGWDCHVYTNHLEGAKELNKRWNDGQYHNTTIDMIVSPARSLFDYHHSNFTLKGEYDPGEKIKFPIAI